MAESLLKERRLRADLQLDDLAKASDTGALPGMASCAELCGNKSPVVAVEGSKTRTVKVGQSLVFVAKVADDGIPRRPLKKRHGFVRSEPRQHGLHLSWFHYRGSVPGISTQRRSRRGKTCASAPTRRGHRCGPTT